jgi:hypothetical protein
MIMIQTQRIAFLAYLLLDLRVPERTLPKYWVHLMNDARVDNCQPHDDSIAAASTTSFDTRSKHKLVTHQSPLAARLTRLSGPTQTYPMCMDGLWSQAATIQFEI